MIENRNKLSVWLRISRSKYLYLLFILPFFYFVVFKYGAMMWLLIAFKKFKATRGLWGSTWVGLKYFEQFIKDPYFWKLVRNTVVLNLLGLVFSFPAPIVLALMINEVRSRRFKKVVLTVSYMPYFISTVAVCGLITTLLSSDGMITNVIRLLSGISRITADGRTCLPAHLHHFGHLAAHRLGQHHLPGCADGHRSGTVRGSADRRREPLAADAAHLPAVHRAGRRHSVPADRGQNDGHRL